MSFNTIKKLSPFGGWGALLLLLLFSCSKESVDDYAEEHEVKFCVGFADAWQEGHFNSSKAKAVTRGELNTLLPPTTDVLRKVLVKATKKEGVEVSEDFVSLLNLTLTNRSVTGSLNSVGVTEFTIEDPTTGENPITEENYTLYDYKARAIIPESGTSYDNVWNGVIPLFGDKDYLSGTGIPEGNLRVYFPLVHNTVLVRFSLGVSSEIDAIRTFRLTSLKIYKSTGLGTDGKPEYDTTDDTNIIASAGIVTTGDKQNDVLTSRGHKYIDFHVNPNSSELFETVEEEEVEKEWLRTVLIVAEYNVYDKADQLLRTGCKAQNTLTLGFTSKEMGRYFDIYATVKPDFLYVLSDGDKETADVVLR